MGTLDSGRHGEWASDAPKSYLLSGKIMLTVIIILFAVVVFLVFLHLYARWYLLRARRRYLERRRNRRQRATQLIFYVDPNNPNATVTIPTRGLAAEVLNSLPVFFYSKNDAAGESGPMECAVCLSEFEENEKGRNLPKCNHSFHTECIDMWFELHSTCPLCRSPVDLVALPESGNNPPDIIISVRGESSDSETGVPESSCGFCPTCQHEGDQRGTTSLAGRRKGFDMAVDVPKRSESDGELRLSSPASSGFKSPGSRLYSLKRILSMNRKGTGVGVSPSSGVGPSYGSVGNESDIELGRYELTQMHTRVPTPRYRSNSQINADVIIEDVRKQG